MQDSNPHGTMYACYSPLFADGLRNVNVILTQAALAAIDSSSPYPSVLHARTLHVNLIDDLQTISRQIDQYVANWARWARDNRGQLPSNKAIYGFYNILSDRCANIHWFHLQKGANNPYSDDAIKLILNSILSVGLDNEREIYIDELIKKNPIQALAAVCFLYQYPFFSYLKNALAEKLSIFNPTLEILQETQAQQHMQNTLLLGRFAIANMKFLLQRMQTIPFSQLPLELPSPFKARSPTTIFSLILVGGLTGYAIAASQQGNFLGKSGALKNIIAANISALVICGICLLVMFLENHKLRKNPGWKLVTENQTQKFQFWSNASKATKTALVFSGAIIASSLCCFFLMPKAQAFYGTDILVAVITVLFIIKNYKFPTSRPATAAPAAF